MPEKTIHYGHNEIVVDDEVPKLVIDGTEIDVNASGDKYWTPLRPHERFLSLDGMAQELIDDGKFGGE